MCQSPALNMQTKSPATIFTKLSIHLMGSFPNHLAFCLNIPFLYRPLISPVVLMHPACLPKPQRRQVTESFVGRPTIISLELFLPIYQKSTQPGFFSNGESPTLKGSASILTCYTNCYFLLLNIIPKHGKNIGILF